MARTATGAITIYDVKDGVHPISMVMSNHNHTFAADSTGTVPALERQAFSCEIFVYVGATRCLYDDVAAYGTYTYRISKVDSTDWASTLTITNNQAFLTVSTIPTGTTNKTGSITCTITVVNDWGNETVITSIISLSKAIEGTAGQVVTLTPTRQTFRYNSSGVTTDGDITIAVTSAGNTGALTAYGCWNGGNWYAMSVSSLACASATARAKAIDLDGVGGDSITFSSTNFSTANNYAIKVTGATGGSDTINIVRVQDGATGPASLSVAILSSDSGFVFKNNAGTAKTLSVEVRDMVDGSVKTPSAYVWKKNGTQVGTAATLVVNATDITDGGSEQYTCDVTVA